MNVRSFLTILTLGLPSLASAQGFAGLGSEASDFAIPERGYALSFPSDHGAHPDYRIEWWYLTANLKGDDGLDYGVQWTLFRTAAAPGERAGWSSPQLWMGHAGLTTPKQQFYAERLARGGIGQAGVTPDPFAAWIDNWEMTATGTATGAQLQQLTLSASGSDFAYDLTLTAQGPLVQHGDRGYSVKSEGGQASYYYSQPRYQVSGSLTLPNGRLAVTGRGWLDREWSSQPLAEDQTGWDWFSLSFDSGEQLMGFILRGSSGDFTSGSWIAADGSVTALQPGAFQAAPLKTSKVAGRSIPTQWNITLPKQGVSVTIQSINEQSWMRTSFPYWEGPVTISGSHSGRGYLEMTGYE